MTHQIESIPKNNEEIDNKDNKKDSSSMSFIDYIKKYGVYVGIIVVVFIAGAILYKKIKDKRGVL